MMRTYTTHESKSWLCPSDPDYSMSDISLLIPDTTKFYYSMITCQLYAGLKKVRSFQGNKWIVEYVKSLLKIKLKILVALRTNKGSTLHYEPLHFLGTIIKPLVPSIIRCILQAVANIRENQLNAYNRLWSIEFKLSSPQPNWCSNWISSAFSRIISLISRALARAFCAKLEQKKKLKDRHFKIKGSTVTYTNVTVWFSGQLKLLLLWLFICSNILNLKT